jgi:hypothetical protein
MPNPAEADKLAAYLAGRRDLKRIERSNAGKVLRRFAKLVSPMRYRRRSTFFAREAGHIIQFLHLHKLSFGPEFRMHVCIRVLNDSRHHVALSGITNDAFKLSFEDNDASLNYCATQMIAFVSEIGEGWFSHWREPALLGPDSPISKDAQDALVQSLEGNADPANVHRSRLLLGLNLCNGHAN